MHREIPADMLEYINKTPELMSLLYDLCLLPEELAAQKTMTKKLRRSYRELYLICNHFVALNDRLGKSS